MPHSQRDVITSELGTTVLILEMLISYFMFGGLPSKGIWFCNTLCHVDHLINLNGSDIVFNTVYWKSTSPVCTRTTWMVHMTYLYQIYLIVYLLHTCNAILLLFCFRMCFKFTKKHMSGRGGNYWFQPTPFHMHQHCEFEIKIKS